MDMALDNLNTQPKKKFKKDENNEENKELDNDFSNLPVRIHKILFCNY